MMLWCKLNQHKTNWKCKTLSGVWDESQLHVSVSGH